MKFKITLAVATWAVSTIVAAATGGSVIVANNDVPMPNPPTGYEGNTVTFYSMNPVGSLLGKRVVDTGGVGIGGGSFAAARVVLVSQGKELCVFASNAATGDITGILASRGTITGNFLPSATDSGVANGVGLAAGEQFLYASYSTSSTIATFAVQSGCVLSFIGDVLAVGLNGGLLTGMAIHGALLIVTYGDGSIGSYNIAGGLPLSNGDAENSSGSAADHLPSGVAITQDGHYAIFGDASTVATLEVADVSSGKLGATTAYAVGSSWNSGNVRLSPDESFVYSTNNSGGGVTAVHFDKTTGVLSPGCSSGPLRGFYSSWSYAGAASLQLPTGTGGLIYVPEFGSNGYSSIGIVKLAVSSSVCTLIESTDSPIVDNDDPAALLSAETYAVTGS